MKIGVIAINDFDSITAHPLFVIQLCENLAKNNEVSLYIPASKFNKKVSKDVLEYQLNRELDFKIVKIPYFSIAGRLKKTFYFISAFAAFFKRCDMLWGFEPYSSGLGLHLGMKSIIELHMSIPKRNYLKKLLKIQKNKNLKSIVSNSIKHSDLLVSLGVDEGKLVAAYNAIPSTWNTRIRNAEVPVMPRKKIQCVYIGSLYEGRGIEEILHAAKQLPDIDFLIIGGPEKQVIKYSSDLHSKNVNFLGQIPHNMVLDWLNKADILLAPYQKHCEDIGGNRTIETAAPMKLFEYMAVGKPIISTNIGAISEIITNGKEGILVELEDLDGLRNAIIKLKNNIELRNRLGIKARERALDFSWGNRLKRIYK